MKLSRLLEHGQSYWLDNLTRGMLRGGELARRVREEGLRGVTSNPAIFHKAITAGNDYDAQIRELAGRGLGPYEAYEEIVLADIRDACDVLLPVYEESEGADGFVSLELSPWLSHDTEGSARDARRLFAAVDRPNVLIKIPGTPAGVPAIEQALYEGVNVNITLLFSVSRYEAVAEAYLRALERRHTEGKPLRDVASVASFFLSRIDVLVDQLLGHRIVAGREGGPAPERLLGRAAVANAKLAYESFRRRLAGERWRALARAGARPQRVLWASTSTKDPLYSDVRYVEPLIGPHTVNTMPEETIAAFADHGRVTPTVGEGVEEARRTMAELEEAGVDFAAVTWQLMNEGVRKFIEPFDALLEAIATKLDEAGGAGARQTLTPAAERTVNPALEGLGARQFGRRLFARDPWLWAAEGGKAEAIGGRLGWVTAPQAFRERATEIAQFAAEVRAEGTRHVVLLGMGGSSLAAEVGYAALRGTDGWPELRVLDDTDPAAVHALEGELDPTRTLFLVASKSGTTVETVSLYRHFLGRLEEAGVAEPGRQFAAITDPGTPLAHEAGRRGFRRTFENPADVGGRYSALTFFGLVPLALAGGDVAEFLERAERVRRRCGPELPAGANPAIRLGAALARLAAAGRDKVTFVASPALSEFGAWAEQLLAESTGKDGRGLIPVDGEPLGRPEAYGDDRVFVHLTAGEPEEREVVSRLRDLEGAGHPVIRIRLRDSVDLGGEFFRWEVATATAGAILGVDPFDEPNVAEAKRVTRELLQTWEANGGFEEDPPWLEEEGIAVHAGSVAERLGAETPRSVGGFLRAWAELAGAGDYLAILPWFRRTPARERALATLRARLRDACRVATTVGYGPRYLHSTGQLHKGGPDRGVFLLLTAETGEDVSIPGESYGFAVLHRAQALGDYRTLAGRGRRVARLHLPADVEAALERLTEALTPAGSVS